MVHNTLLLGKVPGFWLWPLLPPLAPLILAATLMEVAGLPTGFPPELVTDANASEGAVGLRHAGDRILFVAFAIIHSITCLSAIVYFGWCFRDIGNTRTPIALSAVAFLTVIVCLLIAVLSALDPPLHVYQYTYFLFTDIFYSSEVSNSIPAALYVLYPTYLGVISVLIAAGVVCCALSQLDTIIDHDWPERVEYCSRIVLRSFYVLSGVLVSSTITAYTFFRLPQNLVDISQANGQQDALQDYVFQLTTFWGAVFTMTLFLVFARAAAAIVARARAHVLQQDPTIRLSEWWQRLGIDFSLRQHIHHALALLAPVMVGPVGEVISVVGS